MTEESETKQKSETKSESVTKQETKSNQSPHKESMNMEPKSLKDVFDNAFTEISKATRIINP